METRYEASVDLFNELAKQLLHEPVRTIFDIGARDCRETLRFHELHPDARIFAFECNPETLPMCRKAIGGLHNVMLIEQAVMDTDGATRFYMIDTRHTRTSWADGNPGASSLFRASGKYPEEEYASD